MMAGFEQGNRMEVAGFYVAATMEGTYHRCDGRDMPRLGSRRIRSRDDRILAANTMTTMAGQEMVGPKLQMSQLWWRRDGTTSVVRDPITG